jgi:hypothetical protein
MRKKFKISQILNELITNFDFNTEDNNFVL